MSKVENLIPGKVYNCIGLLNKDNFKLQWGDDRFQIKSFATSSTFIFLEFANDSSSSAFWIKGLVNGRILYAARCSRQDVVFREMK